MLRNTNNKRMIVLKRGDAAIRGLINIRSLIKVKFINVNFVRLEMNLVFQKATFNACIQTKIFYCSL